VDEFWPSLNAAAVLGGLWWSGFVEDVGDAGLSSVRRRWRGDSSRGDSDTAWLAPAEAAAVNVVLWSERKFSLKRDMGKLM